MSAVATTVAEGATELMGKLTLDTNAKATPAVTKKSADNQPRGRFLTPKPQEYRDWNNVHYLPDGYTPTAYYYGGYNGPANAWENYRRYVNSDGAEMPHPGIYGYISAPYGPYCYPGTVLTVGHAGQVYGSQHYQYPATYCFLPVCPSAPNVPNKGPAYKAKVSPSVVVDQAPIVVDNAKVKPNGSASGNLTRKVGAAAPKPGQKKSLNDSHPSVFTGGQPRRANAGAISSISAKNHSLCPLPHRKAEIPKSGTAPSTAGVWNSTYLGDQMYTHCGNAFGKSIGNGPNFYGSRPNGCWGVPVDSRKYRPTGRGNGFNGYDNENFVGLGELDRGPRIGLLKNQKRIEATGTISGKGQNLSTTENKEDSDVLPDKDQFNHVDFPEKYPNAKFFVIKSYSEDDVHMSIKYNVWASTPSGNRKLDAAYQESQKPGGCPIFLFFSVNTSGQFVGAAEMIGPVDFNKTVKYWHQDKWTGCFPLKWHIVKDVPNYILRNITLENNDNKPVTNSRDTQEVKLELGLQMLKIFKEHVSKTSVLDDFGFYETRQKAMQERRGFYETRQKAMQERRAKQCQLPKQIVDGNPSTVVDGKAKDGADGATEKPRLQAPSQLVTVLKKEALVGLSKRDVV